MPHLRHRYVLSLIKKAMSHSPIVGILGHRQVGKTTLATQFAGEYVTLDQRAQQSQVEVDPDGYLRDRKNPFVIDECQLGPDLFPALKEAVRKRAKPGQFLLTGSVRFTSRKVIRESLTGRIVNIEVLPLSLSELHGRPLPDFLIMFLGMKKRQPLPQMAKAEITVRSKEFTEFMRLGGLPGICFFRDEHARATRIETHLETVLDRDLRLIYSSHLSYRSLRGLLTLLAMRQGQPIELAEVARLTRISVPTIRRLLVAFEGLFLLRVIESKGEKRPVVFLEDQGIAQHLVRQPFDEATDLLRGIYACVLPQFVYRPQLRHGIYQYRKRGGGYIPLVFESALGTVGILPELNQSASLSAIRSSSSFCRAVPGAYVVIAHSGSSSEWLTDRVAQVPYQLLL